MSGAMVTAAVPSSQCCMLWVSILAAFRVYHTPAKHPPLYGVYLDCSPRQRGCRIVFRQITLPISPFQCQIARIPRSTEVIEPFLSRTQEQARASAMR